MRVSAIDFGRSLVHYGAVKPRRRLLSSGLPYLLSVPSWSLRVRRFCCPGLPLRFVCTCCPDTRLDYWPALPRPSILSATLMH